MRRGQVWGTMPELPPPSLPQHAARSFDCTPSSCICSTTYTLLRASGSGGIP